MKFEVGDRVRVKSGFTMISGNSLTEGALGTVAIISPSGAVGVRFDAPFEDGHKLDGHCEDGYGWWCREDNLQLVTERQHNVEDLYKIWEEK